MTTYSEAPRINEAISSAQKIVLVQADNPDGDSLASALAMDEILSELGKDVYLYCGVDIPSYLSYMPGADRVSAELPNQFDLSIIVDTSSNTLLEQLEKTGGKNWIAAKPTVIIDHHSTAPTITFASVILSPKAVATGEVLYELAQQLGWPVSVRAADFLAIAILSDSLGLTSENTSARTIHIVSELVEKGVSLASLENSRRQTMRREAELVHYKGELLKRVEFNADEHVATIKIPYEEIVKYSPLYNPPMLVLDDMRLAKEINVAVAFKVYDNGRITAKIRCNFGFGVADKLAESFGGGGHPYAAGFKILNNANYDELKEQVIKKAGELQKELKND
jgi:phosphoesterase RecJ-like protein